MDERTTTLERLQQMIRKLSPAELAELRAWISEQQLPFKGRATRK